MVGAPLLTGIRFIDEDRTIFVEPPYTLATLVKGLTLSSPAISACFSSKYAVARQDKSDYDLGNPTHQHEEGYQAKSPETTFAWETKQFSQVDEELARGESEAMGKLAQPKDMTTILGMLNDLKDKQERADKVVEKMKLVHAMSEEEMQRKLRESQDKYVSLEAEMKEMKGDLHESKEKHAKSEMELEEIRGELKKSIEKHGALEDELAAVTEANQDVMAAVGDSDSAALDRIRLRNLLHRAQTCLGLIAGVATMQ
ncbi:hypothetical protein D9615_008124 [Tricholomella constricta]|uniref:Uncharacterized protein n=1 Tax=Tricholomella constricta TaxID=117010 RepID=A0A8H5GVN3_9AGAR|nr:hypothetical protein D9615_008124 [Tricholomella constricta]